MNRLDEAMRTPISTPPAETEEEALPDGPTDIESIDWSCIPPLDDVTHAIKSFKVQKRDDIRELGSVNENQVLRKLKSGALMNLSRTFYRVVVCGVILPILGEASPVTPHIESMMAALQALERIVVVRPFTTDNQRRLCVERGLAPTAGSVDRTHRVTHTPILLQCTVHVTTTLSEAAFPKLMTSDAGHSIRRDIRETLSDIVDPTRMVGLDDASGKGPRDLRSTIKGMSWRMRPVLGDGSTPEVRLAHGASLPGGAVSGVVGEALDGLAGRPGVTRRGQ